MCLAFKKSQRATRKVAKKDIPIFKLAIKDRYGMKSLYQQSHIKLGNLYTSHLDKPEDYVWVNGNFLCYLDIYLLGEPPKKDCKFVSVGLHAFTVKMHMKYIDCLSREGVVVLKGRIPVGAEYYENRITGLVVSSAMVYDEEVVINY